MSLRVLLLSIFSLALIACSNEEAQQADTEKPKAEEVIYDPLDATVRDFNDDDEIHAMIHDVFSADTVARDQFFAEVSAANMRDDIAVLGRPIRIVIEDGAESIKGLELSTDELHGGYHNAVEALIAKAKKEGGGELTEEELLLLTQ